MEFSVQGKAFLSGYSIPLVVADRPFEALREAPRDRLALLQLTRGAATFIKGTAAVYLSAPSALHLFTAESSSMTASEDAEALAVIFHPKVVNCRFSIDSLSGGRADGSFIETENQDRFLLEPYVSAGSSERRVVDLLPPWDRMITAQIENIRRQLEIQPDESWPHRARSFLINMLFCLRNILDAVPADASGETGGGALNDILLFIHGNYGRKLSINDLCRRFATNRTTLAKRFRAHVGDSVHGYIQKLRMRKVRALLHDTTLPVSELMYRAGFSSPTHFSRLFKAETGFTPSAYRKELHAPRPGNGIQRSAS
jgi:AraC-like DNA-binding protein